jgi:riboflavin-specific deaminase-like protein
MTPEQIQEWTAFKDFRVTLTFAQTIDGYISSQGTQVQLSSKESLLLTHVLRNTHDAIMVGINTVLIDNPSLTTRLKGNVKHPRPVIIDTFLKTPITSKFITRSPILFCKTGLDITKFTQLGCTVIEMDLVNDRIDLALVFTKLRELGIKSVMVEGGARIIASMIEKKLMDQVIITIAPKILGSGVQVIGSGLEFRSSEWRVFGPDIVFRGIL